MSDSHNFILIMAGGAGTRLWPISRQKRPKQFQAFVGEQTLLQHMVSIAAEVVPIERIFIMATPEFASVITEQIPELPLANLLYEPARRDNGPAITLGMLQIEERDPEATVAVLWSDHLIQKPEIFAQTLQACFEASGQFPKHVITIGTKPTAPDPNLGYIQMGEVAGHYNGTWVFHATRFIEKPDRKTAVEFTKEWRYFWNVGDKVIGARQYRESLERVQPDLVKTVQALRDLCNKRPKSSASATTQAKWEKAVQDLYEQFPKLSIEYLYMPFITDILVVPTDIGWSDIGNWNTLHDVLKEQDQEHTVTRGEVLCLNTSNSLIVAKDRLIATLGIRDVIVVDDGDVLLVMGKGAAGDIKSLTETLANRNAHLL